MTLLVQPMKSVAPLTAIRAVADNAPAAVSRL